MFSLANLAFVLFGSGELQPFDSFGIDKSKQENVDARRRKISKKLSVAMANFWNKICKQNDNVFFGVLFQDMFSEFFQSVLCYKMVCRVCTIYVNRLLFIFNVMTLL